MVMLQGESIIDSTGSFDTAKLDTLKTRTIEKVSQVNSALTSLTSSSSLESLIASNQEEVRKAIFDEGDGWRVLFPGKRMLAEYAKLEALGNPLIFQNSLIKEMAAL